MQTTEELIDDLQRRVTVLEELLEEFTSRLAQATTATEINLAGGIALDKLRGLD